MLRSLSFTAFAALGLVMVAGPLLAADPAKEIATAAAHAGLASGSADLKMVQTHLHHAINCLVGPAGAGYDGTQANPCKDQGAGALTDAPTEKKPGLEAALTLITDAASETDAVKAKAKAAEAQMALNKLSM